MADGDIKFNMQQFLSEMRAENAAHRQEQRADTLTLAGKLDQMGANLHGRISSVQTTVNKHETRLVVVENTRRSMRWLSGTAIVALIGAAIEFFFNHASKLKP